MMPGGGAVPSIQRIPLPGAEMLEEEPLYVNAKQYHRILKRRQARAKLEAEGKIPKERRVSLPLLNAVMRILKWILSHIQTDSLLSPTEIPSRVTSQTRHAAEARWRGTLLLT